MAMTRNADAVAPVRLPAGINLGNRARKHGYRLIGSIGTPAICKPDDRPGVIAVTLALRLRSISRQECRDGQWQSG